MLPCSSLDMLLCCAGWDLHCQTRDRSENGLPVSPFYLDARVVAYQLRFPICSVGPTGAVGGSQGCILSDVLSIGVRPS